MAVYETSNGSIFEFSFERQLDGSIRAYIVRQPDYGSRDSSLHTTHRLKDGERHYVCWNTTLYTMTEVKNVAADWSKRTDRYIRTGKPFKPEAAGTGASAPQRYT
jgi:hypothetical protein